MLLYLHGFRSSPQSFKARVLAKHMAQHYQHVAFHCPQLPVAPAQAMAMVSQQYPLNESDTVIGSSLGGYYATWLAEQSGCRAILINPAVDPARGLADYVGELRTYHDDQPMFFAAEYLDQLRELASESLTRPERYLLLAAKGDELLDWRDMVARYPGAQQIVLEAGDHSFSDFEQYLDQVIAFALL